MESTTGRHAEGQDKVGLGNVRETAAREGKFTVAGWCRDKAAPAISMGMQCVWCDSQGGPEGTSRPAPFTRAARRRWHEGLYTL